jgi:hypothetical protein
VNETTRLMRIAGDQVTVTLALLALVTLVRASPGAAQVSRRMPEQADQATGDALALTAKVAGRKASASGPGRCARETKASLYDKPAALYLLEYSGTGEPSEVHLTLWRFEDGSPSQFRITVDVDRVSHRISTLESGKREGDGTATLQAIGAGGRIVVQGRDAQGASLEVMIDCKSFQGIEAEGG